jgi:hypothetical protein
MFDPLCKLRPRPGSPPAPTAGAFFFREFVASADSAPAPQIAPLPGEPHRHRAWQRRTNVWRRVTSPARGAKRLRSGSADQWVIDWALMAMTHQEAKLIARHLGLTLPKVRSGDYRVNFRDGNETTAYYTDDLEDAVSAAVEMVRNRDA